MLHFKEFVLNLWIVYLTTNLCNLDSLRMIV